MRGCRGPSALIHCHRWQANASYGNGLPALAISSFRLHLVRPNAAGLSACAAMKTKPPSNLLLVSRAEQQIAEVLGYPISQLHEIWRRGKNAHLESDKLIRRILADYPRAWLLINAFIRHSKGIVPNRYNQNRSGIRDNKIRSRPKGRETIWTSAKPRWVSVSSGGLPTLGRRR